MMIAAGVGLLMVVVYAVASRFAPWSPKRGLGLVYGILATSVFVFEMAYPYRRSRARPLGTARRWLQVHLYAGALAFLAVLIHAGFRWPGGVMGWSLLLLSFWTTFSGLVGVWLQKWLPSVMAEGLRVEALYERIPALVEHLLGEADALAANASDALERFYLSEVRTRLAVVEPSWSYLLDVRAGRERVLEPFRRMGSFVDPAEKEIVDDLATIRLEKMELDVHYSLQGILRRWLILHVPAAALLMALLAVHILSWILY
ncbi:MAG TPA: hypothetical protein VGQ33_18115 [Vicinamibacteria bacterium]|nr:hypothetical protein [Vicinamibacteria bacterium]